MTIVRMPGVHVWHRRVLTIRAACATALVAATFLIVAPSAAQSASAATAQTPPVARAPKPLCFRGRPSPACKSFLLTEVGLDAPLVSSTSQLSHPSFNNGPPVNYTSRDGQTQVSLQLGAMHNRSATSAIGATLQLGKVIAVKARYRRWLQSGSGPSLDLGVGPVLAGRVNGTGGSNSSGVTGDVAYNLLDYGALVARLDLLRAPGHTATAVYGGVRLGSYPALAGTTLLVVAVVLVCLSGNVCGP